MPEQGLRSVNPQLARAGSGNVCVCVCVREEERRCGKPLLALQANFIFQSRRSLTVRGPRGSSFTSACDSPDNHNNRVFGSAATGDSSLIYRANGHDGRNWILIWRDEGGLLWVCIGGLAGGPCRPGLWGWGPVCSHFLTLSVSQPPILKNTLTHSGLEAGAGGKGRGCLNDTGWKGVREPLYIYGLCRSGGSGAVKWSHAPKNSLNSKYMTDSGVRGDGKKTKQKKNTRRETDRRGQCEHCKEYCSQVTAR